MKNTGPSIDGCKRQAITRTCGVYNGIQTAAQRNGDTLALTNSKDAFKETHASQHHQDTRWHAKAARILACSKANAGSIVQSLLP